jgi:hypothetical protein
VERTLARHRQDACATSFTSEMETLYTKPNIYETQHIRFWVSLPSTQPTKNSVKKTIFLVGISSEFSVLIRLE